VPAFPISVKEIGRYAMPRWWRIARGRAALQHLERADLVEIKVSVLGSVTGSPVPLKASLTMPDQVPRP